MKFSAELREAFKKFGITERDFIEVLKYQDPSEGISDLELYLDEILKNRLGIPVDVQVNWNKYLEELEFVVCFSQKPSELFK